MMRCIRIARPFILFFVFHTLFGTGISFAQNIDSLLKTLPQTKDTNRVITLLNISNYYNNKDNDKALEYSLRALEAAKKTNNLKLCLVQKSILLL